MCVCVCGAVVSVCLLGAVGGVCVGVGGFRKGVWGCMCLVNSTTIV